MTTHVAPPDRPLQWVLDMGYGDEWRDEEEMKLPRNREASPSQQEWLDPPPQLVVPNAAASAVWLR